MKKKDIAFGCKIISLFILIMIVINWRIVFKPMRLFYHLGLDYPFVVLLLATSLFFLLLNVLAVIGLYKVKIWGFVTTYIAMIFSTIFLSVSYVPLVDYFYPPQYASTLVILVNACVFSYVVYLQMMLGRVKGRRR